MGPDRHRSSGLQEAPELLGAGRVTELAQRLGLDLPDALAGDGEVLADLLERVLAAVGQAEAQAQHLLLARRQRVEDLVGLLAQRQADDRLHRRHDLLVLDEIAEVAVFLLADRRLQRDRLLRDLEDLAHLVDRHLHLGRDLFRRRLASQLLHELAGGADQLVDRLDHVHRDADRTGLVRDGSGNRLADPPRRVRGELVAPAILELVDRLHQTDVPLLDQVEELEPSIRIFLRDRDHQPEVGLDHLLLGDGRLALALLDDRHDALDLIGAGVGADLGGLDLLLGHPYLLRLGARELLGRPEMEVGGAAAVGALGGGGVAEGDVHEVLDLLGGRPAPVGPELDDALGALDVVEQVAQPLHQPAPRRIAVLAVDDLVADVQRAQTLQDLLLPLLGLTLQPLPGRLLDLAARPAPALAGRRRSQLADLVEKLVALAQEPIDAAERVHDLAGERDLLLLGELLLVDVDDVLDGGVSVAERLAQLAEALEGQVGGEDGVGDLILALLDALGQGDLALTREQGDTSHLAQVETYRVLGAADRARREVDRLRA